MDKYGYLMFVSSVFVEFESLAYIVISGGVRIPCVSMFFVQMYSQFDPETLPFQVVHLSGGLGSTAE